jgi:subtilase family serine protease
MIERRFLVLTTFAVLSSVLAFAQTGPTVQITSPINEHQLVTLHNTVSPLASARNDRGAVPDGQRLDRIQLLLQRSPAQESALHELIREQGTPGSPNYHKWLTPDQFGKQFGPADEDIAAIGSWLASQGFQVKGVMPGKQVLEFSGSEVQFSRTFHTQIHQYAVNGETRFSNSKDPQIPAALAPVIKGFASLNNFRITPAGHYLGKAQYHPDTGHAEPTWTTGGGSSKTLFVVSPADMAVQYDINPVWKSGVTGSQQKIAILGTSNINVAQVNLFRQLFGLSYNPPQVIIDGNDPGIDGANNFLNGSNGGAMEAYLDTEWAGAMAPNATIDLVIAADTFVQPGLELAAEHAVFSNLAPVVSMSFSACEPAIASSGAITLIGALWAEAAAQGMTVLVSSGDWGSATCDASNGGYAVNGAWVNGLASTPFNVAVGGTDFYYSDYNQGQSALEAQLATYWNTTPENQPSVSLLKPVPEQAWNSSQYGLNILAAQPGQGLASGGGGVSAVWRKPAWQTGAGVPDDNFRDIPDVSLFAANGANLSFYPVCGSDGDCQPVSSGNPVQISGIGGTSASVQVFAGLMALINQQYGPQGQANNVLYPLAAQFPKAFTDTTVGTNSVPCDLTNSTPNCIAVADPVTVGDITEGQIGSGTTPWYNATAGYDLATGLGSVDFNQLFTDWGKITFASDKTTLQVSSTSVVHGTPVTFSGSVTAASGTPTGLVAIQTDNPQVNSAIPTGFGLDKNGNYSGQAATLPGGTYDVWARYGGDTMNGPSTSAKTQVTVSPEASTSLLYLIGPVGGSPASPPPPMPYGAFLNLNGTATSTAYYNNCLSNPNPPASCTSPGIATGSMTITDGGTTITTTNLNSVGFAVHNMALPVGKHSLTAQYSGDASFESSTSGTIPVTIVKETPVLIFSPCAIQATGAPCSLQVTLVNTVNSGFDGPGAVLVTPAAAPTGSITISGGPTGMPTTIPLSSSRETFFLQPTAVGAATIPGTLAPGDYNITLNYAGDSNYNATSFATTFTVFSAYGLVSTVTATLSGSIGPTSPGATISGTITGQTGHPAPTGFVAINANGGGLYFIPVVSGSGDSSTYTWNVDQSSLPVGTVQFAIEYSGDSVYQGASAATNVTISNNQSDFSILTTTPHVAVAAGGTGTAAISLVSAGGFAGALTLSCAPSPGVTCSIPSSATLTAGGTASTNLTITAPAGSANMSYNVGVTATDSTGAYVHTLAVVAQVTGSTAGSQSFAFTSDIQSMTVALGKNTNNTGTIKLWGLGGFSGSVALNCSVAAQGLTAPGIDPKCFLNMGPVTLSGSNPQTITVTIDTYTGSTAANKRPPSFFWPATGGTALGLLIVIGVPRRRKALMLLCLVVVFVLAGTTGCSHFQKGAPAGTPGTPPGPYTVTVTGTAGATTQSTSFNLTVTN